MTTRKNHYSASPYKSSLVKAADARSSGGFRLPRLPGVPGRPTPDPDDPAVLGGMLNDVFSDPSTNARMIEDISSDVSSSGSQGFISSILQSPFAQRFVPEEYRGKFNLAQDLSSIKNMPDGAERDNMWRAMVDSDYAQQLLGGGEHGSGLLGTMPSDVRLNLLGRNLNIPWLANRPGEESPYLKRLLWGILGGYGGQGFSGYFSNLMQSLAGNTPWAEGTNFGTQPTPAPAAPAGGPVSAPAPAPAAEPEPIQRGQVYEAPGRQPSIMPHRDNSANAIVPGRPLPGFGGRPYVPSSLDPNSRPRGGQGPSSVPAVDPATGASSPTP